MSENKSVNRLFLVVVVIYLSVSLGFSTLTALVPALRGMSVYVSILLSQSLVFVPCFLYCKLKKIKIRQLVPYRKINFATIVLVVVCTYLMYPLVVVLNAISMLFSTGGSASVAEMIMEGQSLTLNLICVALVPACVEEFMFRGLIFQTYRKSRMLPAILLSAFLFGCMHMNLNQFVYAFALGVYLAFLVEATGSIFSSMIAHFTLNATGVLMSWLLPMLYQAAGVDQMTQIPQGGFAANMEGAELFLFLMGIAVWGVIAIGTTCGAAGVYIAICKINHRWDHVKQMFSQGTKERMVTVSLVSGMALAFAFMGFSLWLERM